MDDRHATRLDVPARLVLAPTLRGLVTAAASHVPNRLIAGYELIEEIGRGGMGIVYKARQVPLDRLVALKMIPSSHADRDDLVRFRTETEAVARLSHPRIVPIYEIGEHDGMPFYTMEYLDGGNLEQLLARRRLAPREAAAIVEQLARAIHHAHSRGVVHRDLKPANVLLTKDDTPKIADFGLARRLDGDPHRHTRSGAIMGTPSYMAPEQALGRRDQGPAVDVWALGAILYELLTGRPAFQGGTVLETMELVRRHEPPAFRSVAPGLPGDLETICLKCLEKGPGRRYATAEALADDLRRWIDGEPIHARPVGPVEWVVKWARRRPVMATLVGVVAALTAIVAAAVPLHVAHLRSQVNLASAAVNTANEQARVSALEADIERDLFKGRDRMTRARFGEAVVIFSSVVERINGPDQTDDALQPLREQALALLADAQRCEAEGVKADEFLKVRDEVFILVHARLIGETSAGKQLASAASAARAALAAFPALATLPPERRPALERARQEVHFLLAEATSRQGDPRAALRLLDGLTGLRAVHLRRARYLAALGQEDAARVERQHAAMSSPAGAIDAFLSAQERLQAGDARGALADLDRALASDPDLFWAHFLRGVVLRARGELDEARVSLGLCIRCRPELAWPYLLRALANIQKGRLDEAEKDLDRAPVEPADRSARYVLLVSRGVVALARKRPDRAAPALQLAIMTWPEKHAAHVNLAEACWQRGDRTRALALIDHAVSLAPSPGPIYKMRARWFIADRRHAEALADLDRAGRLTTVERADRARLLYLLRRYDHALAAADDTLKHDPKLPSALRVRAESLLELGRHRDSVAAFSRYLAHARGDAETYARRARARAGVGDFAGVIADYSQALELRPSLSLWCGRGWAYLINRAPKLAADDFEKALAKSPGHPEALVGRAVARLDLGQRRDAVADVEKALAAGPKQSRVLYAAARVLARAGSARAVPTLERAVQAVPEEDRPRFWREQVRKDDALTPLAALADFRRLEAKYAR